MNYISLTNDFCANILSFRSCLVPVNRSEYDSGWTYYGRHKHLTGKSHFLLPNTNQSLCHLHTFTIDDMRHMEIADMDDLFKSQLCKRCLEILGTRTLISLKK